MHEKMGRLVAQISVINTINFFYSSLNCLRSMKVLGSKVPSFALKASDFAKASTGQDAGQAVKVYFCGLGFYEKTVLLV